MMKMTKEINSKTGCRRIRTGFRFSNQKPDFRFSINVPRSNSVAKSLSVVGFIALSQNSGVMWHMWSC